MNDLISIQMAIEHWGRSSGNLTNDQIAELQREIESLPNANQHVQDVGCVEKIWRDDAVALAVSYAQEAESKEAQDILMDLRKDLWNIPSAETPTVSEKHQLSEETPTNAPTGLISRQNAIEATESDIIDRDENGKENRNARIIYNFLKKKIGSEIIDNPFEFEGWYNRMIWHVQKCYRLQKKYEGGEMAEPKTGDCISRQAALRPFCISPDGQRIPEVDCDNFPVEFSVKEIKQHLRSLPSVGTGAEEEAENDCPGCGADTGGRDMANKLEPCSICELYVAGEKCEQESSCPVGLLKKENRSLKNRNTRLKKKLDESSWGAPSELKRNDMGW